MGTVDKNSSTAANFESLPRSPTITPQSRAHLGKVSPEQVRDREPLQKNVDAVANQIIGKSTPPSYPNKITAEKIDDPAIKSVVARNQTFLDNTIKAEGTIPRSPPITRPPKEKGTGLIPKSPPIIRP